MNQDQSHGTTQGAPSAPHDRCSTQRAMTYQEQPDGIPDSTPITLERDEAWDVFATVLHAVQSWEDSEDPMEQDQARLCLIRDADALGVLTKAMRRSDAPYIRALLDDARAAEAWHQARWFARSPSREERVAAAAQATEQNAHAVSGAEGSQTHA